MEVLIKRDRSSDGSNGPHFLASLWSEADPTLTKLDSWRDKEDMRRWIRNCDMASTIAKTMLTGYLDNAAFFFSEDGRLGICPMAAESGDSVVTLYGSGAQFVLRPNPLGPGISFTDEIRQPPTYQLVGECYLHWVAAGKQTRMDDPQWHDMLHEDPLDLAPWLDPKMTVHYRSEFRRKVFYIE
jgi:hypothetical protein